MASGGDEWGIGAELERDSGCGGGRVVGFFHLQAPQVGDIRGFENRVVGDGDRGFLLFGPNQQGFLRLSPQGDFVSERSAPYDARAKPTHGIVSADGSLFLAGWLDEGGIQRAWFAKLDAEWHVAWERALDLGPINMDRADIQPLPDGSAVVMAARAPDSLQSNDASDNDVLVGRLDAEGETLWQRQLSFHETHRFYEEHGQRMLAVDSVGIHLAVPTDDGVFLVGVDFDGSIDEATRSTPLPESISAFGDRGFTESVGVEALPDGELAIYSSQLLMILDAAGSIRLQRDLGHRIFINAVRFDASRQQLVIVGEYDNSSDFELPAPWARALELSDGAVAWELLGRAPQLTADGTFGGPEGSGPPLYDMAIDPHGNMLFSGSVGRGLEYVWVGSAACAD